MYFEEFCEFQIINVFNNKLTTKSLGTTTEKELENRLHLLTENLIQKQTLIEALQSEKHSIFLQLERSEVINTI